MPAPTGRASLARLMSNPDEVAVGYQGWLWKRGRMTGGWVRRWFVRSELGLAQVRVRAQPREGA